MPRVIYSQAYKAYDFGEDHPFSPARHDMLLDLLSELGHSPALCEPRPATREEILTVHEEPYVQRVESLGRGEPVADAQNFGLCTADNPCFPGMDLAARWLVGGALEGARMIAEGEEQKVLQLGGGLHHAQPDRASGFCIYSDLGVTIRRLTSQGFYVAYLDIDVHHGDGVQKIFYADEKVLTISFHESGRYLFPGTGDVHELGSGSGRGLKLNVPLEPYTEGASYLEAFDQIVPNALEWFKPQILVVQAGADAHFEDPLADLMLTTRTYEALYRRILDYADRFAGGKVLFTLGGGYSPRAVPRVWGILMLLLHGWPLPEKLPPSWVDRWSARLSLNLPDLLHDPESPFDPIPRAEEISRRNRQVCDRLLEATSRYWF